MESLISQNHELVFPHLTDEWLDSQTSLKDTDIFLIEVSRPSTGLGIEIAWALEYNIRIIAIHEENMKISSTIRKLIPEVISYVNPSDMIQKIQTAL